MTELEFLKKLNILYIEDDDSIREEIKKCLLKMVNDVYTAVDGEDGLKTYKELVSKEIRIDAIISDINMPNVNGIDLLKEIRLLNAEIPFLLTTAYSEESYLLDAIKYNTTAYILKPVDFSELIEKLDKVCHTYHQLDTIKKQKKELERYLSAIDNVAIVSKTDTKGRIIFANEIFCEIAQYTREELYGKPHNIVRHPDMPKASFNDLWGEIRNGNTWQGKVKNRAKDGSAYYVNATIIPIFDDFGEDIVEYVGIRFLTTDDEIEKREFKKKVLQNIQDSKKKELENLKQIKHLESKIKDYSTLNIESINEELFQLRDKNSKQSSQIVYYEEELTSLKKKNQSLTSLANEKVRKASGLAVLLKRENDKYQKDNTLLQEEIKNKEAVILDLEKRVTEKVKHIENLQDVIKFKENELENRTINN